MTNELAEQPMSNNEMIDTLKGLVFGTFDRTTAKEREALDMAIKALEQEPCEDCISRQAVEKITWEEPSYSDALNVLTEVRDKVRALPPVTPKPKTDFEHKAEIVISQLRADRDRLQDAIEKIRAEIEQEYNRLSATRADETLEVGECLGLKMALKIVGKYKAESEDKE